MSKRILMYIVFTIIIFNTIAQHHIQGTIQDKNSQPVELATVRLLSVKDSALIQGTRTDSLGKFLLQEISNGRYILSVSNIGFNTLNKTITVEDKSVNLNELALEENVKMLRQVDVSGTAVQVIVKNDTLEYNAQAIKTEKNAVVEDMLKKMPGIQIDASGNITVNGQQVTKIMVDGKKFFDGDVQMSTKNIPADLIDKVQVVDQKSEMARLTGFEDNNTERVINLTIKKDRKQGIFGNIMAGAGADIDKKFRYDSNSFLNLMSGENRATITAGANNVNTARSGRGRGGFGGSTSGTIATQNLGVNLNSQINPKLVLGGDVTFNHSDNLQTSDSHRENYLQEQTYTTDSRDYSNRNNYQGNLRLEAEYKPDTINTLIVQPNIGYTRSFSLSNSDYLYKTGSDSTSWGNTDNNSNSYTINGGLNLIYSHKFRKPGRTFTTNVNTGISQTQTTSYNYNRKNTPDSIALIDQKALQNSSRNNVGFRASYVEPLWKNKHFLETALSFSGVFSNDDRNIYNKDVQNEYSLFDNEYSNNFTNTFFNEALELNYRYVEPKYNLLLGMKTEPSQTFSSRVYGDNTQTPIENYVINYAPTARFQYNFGKRQYIRLDYSGRTNQPSISQMQPVKNNSDLMNETVGNPNLAPEFQNNLRFMFSNYNSKNFSSLNIGLRGSFTQNSLENNSIYDNTGKRYIQTVNGDEVPYNLNIFSMFNLPFLKFFNFSNNANAGLNQQYGYTSKNVSASSIHPENFIRDDLSKTRAITAGENVSLSYSRDKVEFGIRGGLRYSNTTNNFTEKTAQTFDWNSGTNLLVRPVANLTLSTDINYTAQRGYSNFNKDQWLWNASADYTILKGNGVITFRAVDILQQRQNINQSVGDNYIQYSKTNALPSYYLLSFTYKINKFSGSKNVAMPEEDVKPGEIKWNREENPDRPGRGRNREAGIPPPTF